MNSNERIEAEGKTLRDAVEGACATLGIGKSEMEYKLCADHFRGGADTVRIVAWRKEVEEVETAGVALAFLDGLLERMGLDGSVEVKSEGHTLRAYLSLKNPEPVLGSGAGRQILEAFEHLVNKATSRHKSRRRIVVDLDNLREQQDQNLRKVARRVCEKVLNEGCVVTLKPMNSYDRRLVHLEVAKFPELASNSGGEGQMKRVQVSLADSATECEESTEEELPTT